MHPLLLLGGLGAGLAIFGKQIGDAVDPTSQATDPATATADPDRDVTLHDEIIPALNQFLPGTQLVAQVIGEEAVEDISDFFARVDDANRTNIENLSNDLARLDDINRQNLQNLSNDLAKFDDKVRTKVTNIGNRIADVFGW